MEDNSKVNFLIKILAVLIPIIGSTIICYGTIQRVDNQILNNGKRIDQVEKNGNISRVEISKTNERVSKLEILCENIHKSLDNINVTISKRDSSIDKQLRSISSTVAVLKDRADRDTIIK